MRRSFRNGLIVVGVVCLGTGSWTWLQGGEEDGTPQPTVQNSVEVAAPPFVSTPLTETGEAACSDPAALPGTASVLEARARGSQAASFSKKNPGRNPGRTTARRPQPTERGPVSSGDGRLRPREIRSGMEPAAMRPWA